MRWDDLFSDLEQQWQAAQDAEQAAEVVERVRHEVGRVRFVDRLRTARGHLVQLTVQGVTQPVPLRLEKVGPDWLLGQDGAGRSLLVALAAVTSVVGLSAAAQVPETSEVLAKMDLRFAVRGLARDRAPVQLVLVDGVAVAGVVDRVGADLLDVAEVAAGEQRRRGGVQQVRTVPLRAVALVRSSP